MINYRILENSIEKQFMLANHQKFHEYPTLDSYLYFYNMMKLLVTMILYYKVCFLCA